MKAAPLGTALRPGWLLALALAAGGCQLPTDSVHERRIGTLDSQTAAGSVVVPERVALGEEFQVYIVTYGTSCARRGETRVSIAGLRAKVTPYDVEVRPATGGGCEGQQRFIHAGPVRFDEPGMAKVVVSGWSGTAGELVEIEYPVVVEPSGSASVNTRD